jgi:hypothetical protein
VLAPIAEGRSRAIFQEARLPDSEDENRRVLAVPAPPGR